MKENKKRKRTNDGVALKRPFQCGLFAYGMVIVVLVSKSIFLRRWGSHTGNFLCVRKSSMGKTLVASLRHFLLLRLLL